jgi:protein-S-isoprenylcysteine O-methyltransferase Ste14
MRWSNIPVPEAHLASLVAGAAAHAVAPIPLPVPGSLARGGGALLVAFGVGLAGWAVASAGDADVEADSALVTDGAYAFSRNPMYAGWSTAALGLAVARRSAPMLVAWLVAVRALDREVDREEARLSRRFGTDYEGYRRRVPRYL